MIATADDQGQARLERRNATIYLTGLGCSLVGNSALSLVAGIWMKTLTGSSSDAALVSMCVQLPSLFGPLGGLLADRLRQRRLLIALDLVSAPAVASLVLVRSQHDVWLIYLVVLWYGTALMMAGPAESALFARMFLPSSRARMNGRSVALQEVGRLVSPLAGAALFAASGGALVAALDAGTFLVGATATALIRVDDIPEPRPRVPWRTAVLAGVGQLWTNRELRLIGSLATIPMFASGVLVAAQYSLVGALHRPPSFLGVLAACLGAGSVAASLGAGPLIARIGERNLAVIALMNMVAGSVLRGTGSLGPVIAGSVILGAALPWSLIALITAGQRIAPMHMQGQVSAAITLVMFAPQPVALTLGAALIGSTGYRPLYLAVAVILVLSLLLLLPRRARPKRSQQERADQL